MNLGTNDIYNGQAVVAQTEVEMTSLLASLRSRVPTIVLVNLRDRPPSGPDVALAVTAWDAWIAMQSPFVYDEHDAAWAFDMADFFADDEHPNPAGNAVLAAGVQATLAQAGCL